MWLVTSPPVILDELDNPSEAGLHIGGKSLSSLLNAGVES